jgi:Protein of unknown function (DUF4238)
MSNENQHWVPKFLVKNFADTDGRVFRLDIQTDRTTKPPPKHTASGPSFYEFLIEGEAVSFEDRLEKIETRAAPILRHIVSSCSVAGLTEEQRHRVAEFMAAQSFRTEAFYKGMGLEVSREQFGGVFAELWRAAFLVSAEIQRRSWVVMNIESDDIFYLGDHPVTLQRTENPSDGSGLGFDVEGVETFLPLSPRCALYMPCTSLSRQIVSGYETAIWFHRTYPAAAETSQLSHVADTLRVARNVLASQHTRALYNAITKGGPIVAEAQHIENFNALRCSWAHSALYSNRGDFTFARRVFHQSPRYRATPKTSLEFLSQGRR